MNAFGIFAGGGAKGLNHIGAIRAAEERGVRFIGLAGTSAGAIVASLVAVGYTAEQLYDPVQDPRGIFGKSLLDFFDIPVWAQYQAFSKDCEKTFRGIGAFKAWWRGMFFYGRNRQFLSILNGQLGLFTTDKVVEWLEPLLASKLSDRSIQPSGDNGSVLFRDVPLPLKIIATDVSNNRIKVFSNGEGPDATPTVQVAKAVASSMSFPFIFRPVTLDGSELVDGGVLSNFPAWVFDAERRREGFLIPTFAFKLIGKPKERRAGFPAALAHAGRLLSTALSGDEELEVRQIENLHIIPLRAAVSTLDVDMSEEMMDRCYCDGKEHGRDFFHRYIGPRNPEDMRGTLQVLHGHMLSVVGKGNCHLRVNIIMPVARDRLKVLYAHNMDPDPDDQLELALGTGAAGKCWEIHDFVSCNLREAKDTYRAIWNMDKYQQALVRQSLRSLLCVPIFNHHEFISDRAALENPLLGVLCFDSDEDLTEAWTSPTALQQAAYCANLCAGELAP